MDNPKHGLANWFPPLRARTRALGIAAIYAVCATLWIYYSDQALTYFVSDPEKLIQWSVYKGVGFVAVTALALLFLMRQAFGVIEDNYSSLLEKDRARKLAENSAVSEKQFSDMLIESLPGVLYFYDENGRFLRWNRNMENVTGYSAFEIQKMKPRDFMRIIDREALEERIAEVFFRGESSIEVPLLKKDGTPIPYFFTGRRVMFNGQPCLVGVGIDISERHAAEEALRELNETLEQKVKERTEEMQRAVLRAEEADRIKSAFLATMSHELRTPLNSIIGFTGLLLQGLPGPLNPEQSKQLGMVQGSARHLLNLINDVLDISKIEAGQLEIRRESVDAKAAIERALAVVKPLADKRHLGLEARIAPEVGEAVSDQRRFEQILLNLLQNAIKFTENGRVMLTASLGTFEDGRVSLDVQVSDTGIGIREDDLNKLFQPFRQIESGLSRSHEGTGLGLAICQRLVSLLGGSISASSRWGEGSEFTVRIPIT